MADLGFEARQQWQQTFRAIADVIYLHDLDLKILRANLAAVELAGASDERELIGRPYYQVFALGDAPLPSCLQARKDHSPCSEEFFDAARERWWLIESHPVVDDQGRYTGAVHVHRDITERKRLTERMLQMERLAAVGTLAAGVGHDISSPLTYVEGNARFALEQLDRLKGSSSSDAALSRQNPALEQRLLAEVRESLTDCLDGCTRIAAIVQDLKNFSRRGSDKMQWLELKPQIEAATAMVASQVRHKAKVICDYGEVPKIWADKGYLGQVFLNLLINAAQAIEAGAPDRNSVRVSTYVKGRWVCVDVCDSGCGIAPDQLSKVFDAFYTTKPAGQGTGLGLAICAQIMSAHKGRITVRSTPGEGTCFSLRFPLAAAGAKSG